jgi:hypothetical protein
MTEHSEEPVLDLPSADGRDGRPRVLVLGGGFAVVDWAGTALTHQRTGRIVVETDEPGKARRAE